MRVDSTIVSPAPPQSRVFNNVKRRFRDADARPAASYDVRTNCK